MCNETKKTVQSVGQSKLTTVIIKYKDSIVKTNTDFIQEQGAELKHVIGSINAIIAHVPANKIGRLKLDPNVEYIELDSEAHILGYPDETIPDSKKKLLTLTQSTPWGVSKIKADKVWPSGNKGTGIKVGIVDTGIDYNHEDLKGNYKGGYNFVANTSDPFDDMGHGSHVAGIIAALDNDIGVVGVAPEASLYALKALDQNGSGSYSNIVTAIQWCIDNKMQVVNMSFGGSSFSQALKDVCDAANNAGILMVAAAGNSGGSSGQDTIGYPAKFQSVMAIAATDSNDTRASFSSVGSELSVAAPGVSVPSTVPKGTCQLCDPSGYKSLSGTSMACPHTVGTAALVMKANPNKTNADVRKAIETTAIDLGQQGHDDLYGWGRIDALAATGATPPPPGQLKSIVISPATLTINVGATGQLTAVCKDQNNSTIQCPALTWTSDNTGVATVDSAGKVTGVATGSANITAGSGSIVSNVSAITVGTAPTPVLTAITLSPTNPTVVVGGTAQLTAVCKDQNGNTMTCPKLAWTSSDTSIATVDSTGNVTGVAVGSATINATSGSITGSATVTVTTTPPTGSKFDVKIFGNIGIFVINTPTGQYDAAGACTAVCDALKNM